MKPRLLQLLAILPLLLCIGLWAMSYLPKHAHAQLIRGSLLLSLTDLPDEGNPRYTGFDSIDDVHWDHRWLGFRFLTQQLECDANSCCDDSNACPDVTVRLACGTRYFQHPATLGTSFKPAMRKLRLRSPRHTGSMP